MFVCPSPVLSVSINLKHKTNYSQRPLIRTLKGQKVCSNLLKVVIKTSVGYQNERKTQETAVRHIFKLKCFGGGGGATYPDFG